MTTTKPRIPRVYVTVFNRETGKSKSVTFYNSDPEPANVVKQLQAAFRSQQQKKQPVPSA